MLDARTVEVDAPIRPFVGAVGADGGTVAFLTEMGYVVDDGPNARECTLVLDGAVRSPVELIRYIEESEGPLMRFSKWPSEAKSALCLAGDLDALSLRDYARRLVRTGNDRPVLPAVSAPRAQSSPARRRHRGDRRAPSPRGTAAQLLNYGLHLESATLGTRSDDRGAFGVVGQVALASAALAAWRM